MKTAKLFRHGGSQAVRLPKAFRFEGTEVVIERAGEDVLLRPLPRPRFATFAELARDLSERFPATDRFPEPPARPAEHDRPAPSFG